MGDVLNATVAPSFKFNSFRLRNISTPYVFDNRDLQAVTGPLPFNNETAIRATVSWYRVSPPVRKREGDRSGDKRALIFAIHNTVDWWHYLGLHMGWRHSTVVTDLRGEGDISVVDDFYRELRRTGFGRTLTFRFSPVLRRPTHCPLSYPPMA